MNERQENLLGTKYRVLDDESLTSANLRNDYWFIIKKYSLH